jgi:hypothetical protein
LKKIKNKKEIILKNTDMDNKTKKELYSKKYSFNAETNGRNHLTKALKSWIKGVLWYYDDNGKERDSAECEALAKELFVPLYNGEKPLFWTSEQFENWLEAQPRDAEEKIAHCYYCKQTPDTLSKFFELIDSDRYQRGQNYEIDRRHNTIRTLPEEERESVIEHAKKVIADRRDDSVLFTDLKEALQKDGDNYLYLPAPYNAGNCVFACAWCNSAKTDAFTDKQFMPVGEAIGKAIGEAIKSAV